MRRGTTPTIKITLNGIDLTLLKTIYVTLEQGKMQITKTGTDLVVDTTAKTISMSLTETETISLKPATEVFIQMRAVTIDDKAVASNIKTMKVSDILYEGNII